MIAKPLLAVAALPLLAAGAALSSSWVVVDVREAGPAGHHIVVPFPLVVARAALHFAPADARHVDVPDLAEHLAVAGRVLAAFGSMPDAELVHVEHGEERVSVRKSGDEIVVDVHGGRGETVHAALPLAAAARALRAYDGRGFATTELVAALGSVSRTDLVHVTDGRSEVKVWVW